MTAAPRREATDDTAEDTRARILAATASCLVRDGLANVRMASIATEAGVSSGLLHYHFDTKAKLFAEVLVYSSAQSNELTERVLAATGDEPAERLSTFLDRCLPSDETLRRDWVLWHELDALCLRQPALAAAGDEVYDLLYDSATGLIEAGIADGAFDLDPADARTAAEAAVALCDGIGARVLEPDDLDLDGARARVAFAVGRLVGHDGPLPRAGTPRRARRRGSRRSS